MMGIPCLTLIRNQYGSLTKVEQSLADYIFAHPEQAAASTAAVLAQKAGTAGSAVIRFCQSLGFKGFSDFKLRLAVELSSRENPILPTVMATDSCPVIFQKVFVSSVRTLQDTLSMLDPAVITRVVERLKSAKRICFFGIGTSSTIAIDAQYRIMQLGYSTFCSTDHLFMLVTAANITAGEVAIGISHSGRTQATIDALRLAKQQGAFTVVITSYKNSPICRYADEVITVFSDEQNYPVEAVSARVAHICVLDALSVSLAMANYPKVLERYTCRDAILQSLRMEAEPT